MLNKSPVEGSVRYVELSDDVLVRRESREDPENSDEVGLLSQTLKSLAGSLEARYRELEKITSLTSKLNAGLSLDSILDSLYDEFRSIIPYDRMGLALLGEGGELVSSFWSKTESAELHLKPGYGATLEGSSLGSVVTKGVARIINDLEAYLEQNPSSESTKLLLSEGIKSSLTCPLVAGGKTTGFLFFSSATKDTYANVHVAFFKKVAEALTVIIEKGKLLSMLIEQRAEVERQNRKLRALNERKNQFVGMAAHDLRGPISSIRSVSEILLDEEMEISPSQQREFLEVVNRQCEHMLQLINGILDITEIESGSLNLKKSVIDLRQFLEERVFEQELCAAKKGSSFILETVCEGELFADAIKLKQVVDNLLSNALKYSPPGATVMLGCRSAEDHCAIYVRDEGPGLSEEECGELFQDFKRLSSAPTGGERSTGLGLAISRRIVEAHGGVIEVESRLGEGSIFTVKLPWRHEQEEASV